MLDSVSLVPLPKRQQWLLQGEESSKNGLAMPSCPIKGLVPGIAWLCTLPQQHRPFIEHELHARHCAKLFIILNPYFL